jgi:hypothetical protein
MKKLMLLCVSLLAMAFFTATTPVHAQNLSWVSPNGSDSNSCSQTSPCATFAGAISKGGVAQINCLGSGNYGALNGFTVSISGSIVIDCGAGNVGEMTTGVVGTDAITINTSSSATIVLRHLSLNGGGKTGVTGINAQGFTSGTLIIEDCMIHGFHPTGGFPSTGGNGILFTPSSGRGLLQVSNSLIFDNGTGIAVSPASGVIASVAFNGLEITGNLNSGLVMSGPGVVAGDLRYSLVGENGLTGVFAAASQTFLTIEESSIIDNLSYGILAGSAGTIVNVGASTIGGNGFGVGASAGSIISFGNNQMSSNGSNGAFTSTTPLQ